MNDARKYGTTNPVLIEARIAHDPFDVFAWCQEWRFAIAQFLTDAGEYAPGYRGADGIRESYAYEMLSGLYPESLDRMYERERDELFYALNILDRYREWLRAAGEDY